MSKHIDVQLKILAQFLESGGEFDVQEMAAKLELPESEVEASMDGLARRKFVEPTSEDSEQFKISTGGRLALATTLDSGVAKLDWSRLHHHGDPQEGEP